MTKDDLLMENNGYYNGHASYMITKVPLETFLDWAVSSDEAEEAGVSFVREGNGAIYFETYEKFPELGTMLSLKFPESVVYETDSWDEIYANCYCNGKERNDLFTASLTEHFADYGNIRLDFELTDKDTGAGITFGDLLCFDEEGDITEFEEDREYIKELASYAGITPHKFISTIFQDIENAKDYFRTEELSF